MWCLTFVPVVSIRLLYRNQSTPLRFLKILKFSYLNMMTKFFKKRQYFILCLIQISADKFAEAFSWPVKSSFSG